MVDEILIVERLFDALSHFEGEMPKISALIALLADRARIRDGAAEETRGRWLDRLASDAVRRAIAREGSFFVVVRCSATRHAGETTISFLVEQLRTAGGVVRESCLRLGTVVVRGNGRSARIHALDLSDGTSAQRSTTSVLCWRS